MAYSEQQIQQAMRAAIAAGDREAVADLRQRLTEAYQASSPSATEGMSGAAKFRAGVGQGMTNIVRQAGNIVGLKSDEALQDAAGLDRALLDTGAGKAGSIVGEIAATAPVGGLAAGGARALGAGAIRAGLAEGAVQGGLTAGPGGRLGGATAGAAMGAVLPGAGAALRRVAQPLKPTGGARELLRRGVNLTPGEIKPTGTLNQMEQALESSPLFGSAIRNRRAGSVGDFQRAVAQETAPTGGAALSRGGDVNDLVEEVGRQYGKGYDQAIGGYNALEPRIVRTAGGDVPLHSYPNAPGAVEQAAGGSYPGRLITPQMRTDIGGAMQGELSALDKLRTTGRELQGVRSNLRTMARDTDVPGERALLRGGEQKFTEALESQLAPQDAALLKALDAKYPEFKILQDVTKRGGDQPGGWTPAQLSQSVRAATDLGEYSKGGGPLRKLSKAGRQVFEQRSMPTGERVVTTSVLGKAGLPIASTVMAGATRIPGKTWAGMTPAQRKMQAALVALRRKYKSDLQAGQSLGTAGLIQANQE